MDPTVRQLRSTSPVLVQLRLSESITVMISVLCGVALVVTIFRLYLRFTRSKLWWDDFWAFFAGIITICNIAANFLHTANPGR